MHEFDYDRSNFMVNVGPVIYGPVAVAVPKTVSEEFRLVISQMHSPQPKAGFSLVELKGAQVFENFIEKTLGKVGVMARGLLLIWLPVAFLSC